MALSIGLWFSVNVVRFSGFAREVQDFDNVLSSMERGKRAAGMLVCNSSTYFSNPVYLHFTAWYQAELAGIADMSFAINHPTMVRYRDMNAGRLGDDLAWQPQAFTWERDGGNSYDYFLVCAGADVSPVLFKEHISSVELESQQGSWWLYRNTKR